MNNFIRTLLATAIMLLCGTAAIGSMRVSLPFEVREVLASVVSIRVEENSEDHMVSTIDNPEAIRSLIATMHSLRRGTPSPCVLVAVLLLQSPRGNIKLAVSSQNISIHTVKKGQKWKRQGIYHTPKELLVQVTAHLEKQKAKANK